MQKDVATPMRPALLPLFPQQESRCKEKSKVKDTDVGRKGDTSESELRGSRNTDTGRNMIIILG